MLGLFGVQQGPRLAQNAQNAEAGESSPVGVLKHMFADRLLPSQALTPRERSNVFKAANETQWERGPDERILMSILMRPISNCVPKVPAHTPLDKQLSG